MSDSRPVTADEPRLGTGRRPRRRFPRRVLLALPLALAGPLSLLLPADVPRPYRSVVTIEAEMASRSDFSKDREVQRLLLGHGIRVDIHRLGSRGIATRSIEGMDVVSPSGRPAAKMILDRQQEMSAKSARPFVTPLVLATFRDYARPDGVEFQARCLGKVRSWNRQAREPALDPLAVFR
ncbi:hypothetical protein ACIRBZ_35780 [Streptomyces sp. NPDC094038]|uniref:hypothetical protein n=1 Tax=Streptomyces sp. NPDC094038 TaxID=3366055 RepID=UPI003815D856